jgi:lysyl-tRNA synthetase, class II
MTQNSEYDKLKDVERRLSEENHLIAERIRKLNELRDSGITPYPYKFDQKHHAKELQERYSYLEPHGNTDDQVSAAGRIVALRRIGKVTFMHLLDSTGKIQAYFKEEEFHDYNTLKLLDMGDYIGVKGKIFKTKTGEVTINSSEVMILSKSLRPLPEKFHGIHDTEIKYRQRYLDLITSEESRNVFMMRTKILKAVREFFDSQGFMEVETNTLETIYGGAAAKPFITHHNELDTKLFLRISLELHLKRLIAGGFERVYEIGKVFRNESIDTTHNPEFTMLESYAAYWDYNDVMEFVEDCYNHVALKVLGTTKINYQGTEIELKKPWERISMKDALKKYAGIDIDKLDDKSIRDLLNKHKIEHRDDMPRGLLINQLFKLAETKLIQPVFIIDHPKETTPLCKLHRDNPELIERFEPYINSWEIGNAYSELNDPIMQRHLLEEQAKELRAGLEESNPMDEDFCKAVEYGMPPMGGLGLGMDRMIMLLTNSVSIRDIVFFPTMKNVDDLEIKR